MGKYKDMIIPDELDNVIEYMKDVDSYREELTILGQAWDLLTILGQMGGGRTDMTTTREGFRDLTEHLIGSLGHEILAKTIQDLSSKAQVTVDIIIRNLFERTADIGFLATDDDIRDFIRSTQEYRATVSNVDEEAAASIEEEQKISNEKMIVRFQEYVAKYSVYHNIILLDTEGNVLTQLDQNNPVKKSSDPLIAESLNTQEEYVETFRHSDLLPDESDSLIYSYRVTETNDSGSRALGVLCLCFRFDNEMEDIFDNLSSAEDRSVLTLLDKEGKVIASNRPYQVPVGAKMELALDQDFKVVEFSGIDYIAKTLDTKGYQGFSGLGWYGHVMLPLSVAFKTTGSQISESVDQKVLQSVLSNPELFSEAIQNIPHEAETIQNDLDRTVWNGNVLPEDDAGTASSSASKVLLWEISKTGMKTKNVFEAAIKNLHGTVISTFMNDVDFLASLAIDIMDRNLYERANDCRWWALTSEFRRILAKDTIDQNDADRIKNILAYINDLYTVYTNLFVYDKSGKIIATSNPSEAHIVGETISERWISETLSIKDSQVYSVSAFAKTPLYGDRHTYTYNASITDLKNSNSVLGGIGVVFDSEPEFNEMLLDSLPRKNGDLIPGCFGVFTDKSGSIISSTNDDLKAGDKLEIDPALFNQKADQSSSQISIFNDHYYAVGIKASSGYREYKSEQDTYKNDVISFIFMELDKVRAEEDLIALHENTKVQSNSSQRIPLEDFTEIATFYVGDRWYGIKAENVVEAIELSRLSPIPGTDEAIMGTLFFNEMPLLVLNPGELLDVSPDIESDNLQIIVMKTSHGEIGLAVDSLGEIPKIENHRLDRDPGIISESSKFIHCMVKPEDKDDQTEMLIVLDPDGIITHVAGDELLEELA